MSSPTRVSTFVFLTISCVFWIDCSSDNGVVDPSNNVSNTNFTAEQSFSFREHVTAQSQLQLDAINGTVTITGTTASDSLIITGERRVRSESVADAQANLQNLEVNVQNLANEVSVKTVQPDQANGRVYQVDYRITLPMTFAVLVKSINGDVTVDSVTSTVVVNHVNGTVFLEDVVGNTTVTLENGRIESEVTIPQNGTIDMRVTNGNLGLDIPVNTSANFSARVTNGTIGMSNLVLENPVSSATFLGGR
ncbi:MAG: hypothetical protein OEM41_04410, partial [Ignavibacteria bacterium]|nr:hypothetical protein [Ignavibacteria bacterium]